MKKAMTIGFLFVLIVFLYSFLWGDWALIYRLCGVVGLASMLLSGLFLGAFVSGVQVRANVYSETKEDRQNRNRYAYLLFAFGIPNLAAGVISLMIM